jgi:hypothetical protein
VALPPFTAKAAGLEVCDPDPKVATSFCVTYDFSTPTTIAGKATDVDITIDNSSTNFASDQNVWLDTITIDMLDSAEPSVTPSASMPNDLLIAGGDMDCVEANAFADCNAGKGTFLLRITGSPAGIVDGFHPGTFGITKITNAPPAAPGAIARYEVEARACATVGIFGPQCTTGTTFISVADVGGVTQASMPGSLTFAPPAGSAEATFDAFNIHLEGESSTLDGGMATANTTIFRLPAACGPVSGTGSFESRDTRTVSAVTSVITTNCTTNTVNAKAKRSKVNINGVIGHADMDALTPGTNVTVQLFAKKRGFKLKGTALVPIDANGNYAATLKQGRTARKCRIVSTFPGDAMHGPSATTKSLRC